MERILVLFLVSLALLEANNIGVQANKTRPRRSSGFGRSSSQFFKCFDFIGSTFRDRHGFSSDNKCLGETYQFGLQLDKYGDECSVEPKNESVSLGDCFWTLHKCIAVKSLSGRSLSLENYADMMAGNLSDVVKSKIMSTLKSNSYGNRSAIKKDHGNVEADFLLAASNLSSPESQNGSNAELKDIKKYWKSYFDAEFQVCTNTSNGTCDNTTLGYFRRAWDYGAHCGDYNIPYYKNNLLNYNVNINVTQLKACVKSYNESHTIKKWTGELRIAVRTVCELVIDGTIDEADLDKPLDFEFIYNHKIVSNFLSRSVKQQFFNQFRLISAQRYTTFNESIINSESIPEIVSFALEDLKAKREIKKEKLYYSPEWVIIVMNMDLSRTLSRAKDKAISQICSSPTTTTTK